MGLRPFECEFGIEAAGLRQGGRRLFHLALECIGGAQTPASPRRLPYGIPNPPANKQFSDRVDLTASLAAHRISLVRNGRERFRRIPAPCAAEGHPDRWRVRLGGAERLVRALRINQVCAWGGLR